MTTKDREQPAQENDFWNYNFRTFLLLSSPFYAVALRVLGDELVLAMAQGL